MRGATVTMGGPRYPDLTVAQREGVRYLVWEARDPEIYKADPSPAILPWARSQGFSILTMRDPTWSSPVLGPLELAEAMSKDITMLGGGAEGATSKAQHAVMPDIEHVHDADWIMACYKEFRRRRSGRGFYLTTEWHQTAWFSQELKDAINTDKLFYYLPQAYETTAMIPVDPRAVLQDCKDNGLDLTKVSPFLRFDRIDKGWDGFFFPYIFAV